MADRDHQYYIEDGHLEEHEDEDEEEDDIHDERIVEGIDVDNPDEFDDDQNGTASEPDSEMDEFDGNGRQILEDDENGDIIEDADADEDGEDDEDAMTWDTMSEASEVEAPPVSDEWYPLIERKTQFPNFALPTTTRQAFNNEYIASTSRSYSPACGSENISDQEDVNYNEYIGVMRPDPTRKDLINVALDYFLHHGHSEVVHTFCKEMKIPLPEAEIKEMNVRNEVRDLILAGEMEQAIEKMLKLCPKILDDEWINFVVRKQHIIEMIRAGQAQEPVDYFRAHLMKDGKRPPDERMEILEKVFTLMVFSTDEGSEFHVFYEQREREQTAKEVNSAILGLMGKSKSSQIDLLAKSFAYVKNDMTNTYAPQQKSTTVSWANKYFETPFGLSELIEKAIKICPLDETKDLC